MWMDKGAKKMDAEQLYDVTIIGGGPAGLFAAFYSGLREMKTKIIEYQPNLGGKVHVYPEKLIWDIGGIPPITGSKFIEQVVQQGLTFDPTVLLGEKVTSLDKNEANHFVIHTASGHTHYSKTVVLAIGSGILTPTKLDIAGAERFEVSNLQYTVQSLARFKDKVVLISGGGNSAVDWANELEPIAKKVYLIYRKDLLKGHEAEVSKLSDSSVDCLLNTSIQQLIAAKDKETIEKVELINNENGQTTLLSVDEVVINHGFKMDHHLIQNSPLQINMANEYGIEGTSMSETSIEGLYAVGDILHHNGKLHLIAGAFQDAANAINKAKQYITPHANEQAMVSSHNERFKEKNRKLVRYLYKQAE